MARGKERKVDPASLAGRLRALRKAADLSQPQAVEATRRGPGENVSQAQLSRIETEVSQPTPAQAASLLAAYGAIGSEAKLITDWVDSLAAERVDARVILQTGGAHNFQRRVTAAVDGAKVIRSYQNATVLGPLQTHAYATAVFTPDTELTESDAAASLTERMTQTSKLDEPGREWHLIQTEASLRAPVHSYRLQAEQVEHIIEVSRKANVRIGVVPIDTVTAETGPLTGFHLYNDEQVIVGTDNGTALMSGTADVEKYVDLFGKVESRAVFGDEARAVLARIAERYRSRT